MLVFFSSIVDLFIMIFERNVCNLRVSEFKIQLYFVKFLLKEMYYKVEDNFS